MSVTTSLEHSDLAEVLINNGLFQPDWYTAVHTDVAKSGLSAEAHFRQFGLLFGRPPCPDFEQRLKRSAVPPLERALLAKQYHFLDDAAIDIAEETNPVEFNEAFYLQTNPMIDLRKFPNPYAHFLKYGYRDLRNPGPDFDLVWYAQNYRQEFSAPDENPFLHYLREGKARGYLGHPPPPRGIRVALFAQFARCAAPRLPICQL